MSAFKYLIATAICLSLPGCAIPTKGATQIEQEILLQRNESWDGMLYKAYPAGPPELTLIRLKIPAHTRLPWHTHPMPSVAYILSGELTVRARKEWAYRTLGPGQTLAEMVDTDHFGSTGNTPVELLVFYAGSPDMPLSQPSSNVDLPNIHVRNHPD